MNERREPFLDGAEGSGPAGTIAGADTPVAALCDAFPVPAGATVVVFGADGQARRQSPADRASGTRRKAAGVAGKGESAWWFMPGPHAVALVPFAGAPEVGLRLAFVIDTADPRLARQRFDLFLFSEVAGQSGSLPLADLAGRIEAALRAALAGGSLDLPPCTSLDEWNAFRAGLDELLYMRFGITVDDCVPIGLDDVDYAGMLRRRATAAAPLPPAAGPVPAQAGRPSDAPAMAASPEAAAGVACESRHEPARESSHESSHESTHESSAAADDAAALRRLFLELPEATRALRLLPAPAFAVRQAQLQQLGLAALEVNTMPALAWSAPGRRRAVDGQRRLACASMAAMRALDELWAALAHMKLAAGGDGDDDIDRIVANCAFHLAARRADAGNERREPNL